MNTVQAFGRITAQGFDIFQKKYQYYGASWHVLRTSSLTDQIFIKAKRIRQIQEIGTQKEQPCPYTSHTFGLVFLLLSYKYSRLMLMYFATLLQR